eukprot:TRINITY_DN83517_c0_g1_i1.p1 TRINITY_DN83517_c0_g1~~TRINITY_DN83517_c0_g1_i1.p1  ORF type:complete len:253 (+),score=60.20 TRINITY_DN83517_c0_g1_i1:90-848(+)
MASNRLLVRNLPGDIKESEVQYIFGKYGTVLQVELVLGLKDDVAVDYQNCALAPVVMHIIPSNDIRKRVDTAAAFVTYSVPAAAETAIRMLNHKYKVRSTSKDPLAVRFAMPDQVPEAPKGPSATQEAAAFAAATAVATPRKAALGGFSDGPTSSTYAHVAEKAKCKLFVGNLFPEISQDVLRQVFGQYGHIVHIHIKTGKSRFGSACAFVELASPHAAEVARRALHQTYDQRIGGGGAPIQVTFFQSGGKR